jgi:hypothetical protein
MMAIAELPAAGFDSDVPSISADLQAHQRQRVWYIRSRNMLQNRLWATVAGNLGYCSGMKESEREEKWKEAKLLVERLQKDEVESDMAGIIVSASLGIDAFESGAKMHEGEMEVLAKRLPVAEWVERPEQKGFGILSLATVIGETGDLNNYDAPSKVWRRMACAPFTKGDETLMGKTWKMRIKNKEGLPKLSPADWEDYGYAPRRRSVSYLIGENLMRGNQDKKIGWVGPYRKRYDDAKRKVIERHPDRIVCPKCKGERKAAKGGKCGHCKGTGQVMKRVHLHGMLLATKLLYLNLWLEWTGTPWQEWRGDWFGNRK